MKKKDRSLMVQKGEEILKETEPEDEASGDALQDNPSGSGAYVDPVIRSSLEFVETFVGKKDRKCPFCGRVFNRPATLRQHVMIHSGFKGYKCSQCPKSFANRDLLVAHGKIHEKGNFPCQFCPKTFPNQDYVRRHERRHKLKKEFECEICEGKFGSRDIFLSHMKSVHFCHEKGKILRRKFTCEVCKQIFWQKTKYLQHQDLHKDKSKMCFYCNKKISDRQNLKKHCRRVHPDQPIMLPRQRKVKSSDTAANRKIDVIWEEYHPRMSPEPMETTPDGAKVLQIIKHNFQTSWEFAEAHVKPGDVQCGFCKRIFPRTEMLRRHMLKHSGIDESKCPKCLKVFAHHESLHEHMLCHVQEEHPCKVCGKVFQNATYLKKHMKRTHGNPETFTCSVCKSTFTRPEYLEDHVMTFHDNKTSPMMKKLKKKLKKETEENEEVLEVPEVTELPEDYQEENVYTVETLDPSEEPEYLDEAFNDGEENYFDEHPNDAFENFWVDEDEGENKIISDVKLVYLKDLKQPPPVEKPPKQNLPEDHSFSTQADFLRAYVKDTDRTCPFCQKTFNHLFQLKQHIVVHSGLKEFKCPKCKKEFLSEVLMQSHLSTVHTKERHPCKQCGKVFKNSDYLRRHERRHKYSIIRYECCFCDLVYDSRDKLKFHLKVHYKKEHGASNRTKYSCDRCKKIFTIKRLYLKHREEHEHADETASDNEMAFEDLKVKKENVFCIDGIVEEENSESELISKNKHIKTPPDPLKFDTVKDFVNECMRRTDFTCYECGKVFPQHRLLRKHILSHAGIKDYKCLRTDCKEVFDSPEALEEHVKENHSKHICNLCGKQFKQLAYLTKHLQRHQEIKYECEICSRKYTTRYALKCHFKKVHYDKNLKKIVRKRLYCTYCDEYCWSKSSYRKHQERHILQIITPDSPSRHLASTTLDETGKPSRFKSAAAFVKAYVKQGDRKCCFCDKSYSRPALLKLHILVHSGFRDYKCPKCPADFVKEHLLNAHFVRVHASERHPCKICRKEFRNSDYLKRHLRRHTLPRKFECEHCGLKFTAFFTLKCHILRVHYRKETGTVSKKKYFCNKCKRAFWKKSTFEGHQKIHTRKVKNQWIKQGKADESLAETFIIEKKVSSADLDVKVETVMEDFDGNVEEDIPIHEISIPQPTKIPIPENHPYKTAQEFVNAYTTKKDRICCFCERLFRRPALLRRHMVTHSGFRDHKCPYDKCTKDFAHEDLLRIHMETVHAPDRYPCKICGKIFRTMERMSNHMHIHSSLRTWSCTLCDKIFTTDSGLRKHRKRKHTELLPKDKPKGVKYKCGICKLTFSQEEKFEKHKNVHKDRTVICFYCNKSMLDRSNLRVHCRKFHGNLPIDANDGPPVCTVCNALCENIEALKEHFESHGEDPFECATCGSSFKRQEDFREHIQINHFSEDVYPCYMCGMVFETTESMKQHRTSHLSLPNPFPCEFCSKNFSTVFLLNKHKETHHLFEVSY
ncbi:zinc finger protein 208-like [Lutzomyia longipalpis]|uniref:zinc finger protein 208-like n=1 Tax=Lutzomyia longipalpis TaxID=7200 RepID=UPI0024845370|nr:zinc finger protein 208-like [Lutzomyia longipalpis]